VSENSGEMVALRKYIESRLESIDKATKIQTKDLKRRLDDFKVAHEKAIEERRDFLLKDTFETSLTEVRRWREQVTKTLAEEKGKSSTLAAIYAVVASLVVGLVVLVVSRAWK
jgi:hypothetical protein